MVTSHFDILDNGEILHSRTHPKRQSIGIWFNRPRLLVRYILENRGRRLHTWLMVEAILWWVSCQNVHSEFTMLMTSVLNVDGLPPVLLHALSIREFKNIWFVLFGHVKWGSVCGYPFRFIFLTKCLFFFFKKSSNVI